MSPTDISEKGLETLIVEPTKLQDSWKTRHANLKKTYPEVKKYETAKL